MYRPITRDVNVSEMVELREQGLTNSEIANRLGVSAQTVRKYIGAMPHELRSKAIREARPSMPPRSTPIKPVEQLPVLDLNFTLQGKFAKYEINLMEGTIEIVGENFCGELKSAQIKSLCEELQQMNAQYNSLAFNMFATGTISYPSAKNEEEETDA